MNRTEMSPLNNVAPPPRRKNRRAKNAGLAASINNLNASIVLAANKLENLDDEMDLRKDYQEAVECLKLCESIIGSLEEKLNSKDEECAQQLASKDEEIASKDKRIASLEEKIVQMSLELASTKASEQELKHANRRLSAVSASSNSDFGASFMTTSSSSAKMSFTSLNGSARWGLDDSNSASVISMSSFGQLFRRRPCAQEEQSSSNANERFTIRTPTVREERAQQDESSSPREVLVHFPKRSYDDLVEAAAGRYQPRSRRRTPPSRARLARQKSSRSFLENRGVVFPVSSTDCIDKGCLDLDTDESRESSRSDLANEEWPEFR